MLSAVCDFFIKNYWKENILGMHGWMAPNSANAVVLTEDNVALSWGLKVRK